MHRDSRVLSLAALAIGFAAADTYVVVLALPDMMTAAGLSIDEFQKAAPIVSGFLLGYVGVLPFIGRVSDLRGRTPVLLGSLLVFALGSVVTASGYDLTSIVVGRFIQGVGGGGLIPPTLALIADRWPPEERGLPLGIVGAVQELGSVLGPLLGAAILALGTWHDIFWVNCAVGLALAIALWLATRDGAPRQGRTDVIGLLLLLLAGAALLLVLESPDTLTSGITTGLAFIPVAGAQSRWLTPLALAGYALLAAFGVRQATAKSPLLDVRGWVQIPRLTDVWGAGALTVALGAVILTFASADPEKSVISEDAAWLLPLAGLALAVFWWRQRTAAHPLVPRGALSARPAWGSLVVSFLVGAALIAIVVDVPVFARLTTQSDSQLGAALVLLRFMVAVPLGAVAGGWLLGRTTPALLSSGALALTGVGLLAMSRWDADTLTHTTTSTLVLAATGLGIGLAIAPVNEALLDNTDDDVHGVASALVVVARMIGMLVGISLLTALGLRAFERSKAAIPPVAEVCAGTDKLCPAYTRLVRDASLDQVQFIFLGAAASAIVAAALAGRLLRQNSASNGTLSA